MTQILADKNAETLCMCIPEQQQAESCIMRTLLQPNIYYTGE
jgi:hypothetical protein